MMKASGAAMRLDIINPKDWPLWDDLVLATDGYSFFHSADWAQVLCSTYNYKPAYFTLIDEGKMQALMPFMEVTSFISGRRGVSLTFTDYCEPVVESQDVFDFMLRHIIAFGKERGWKHIDLRGGQKFLSGMPVFSKYLRHTLVLTNSEEEVHSGFRGSTRRNIKKAREAGVAIRISKDFQAINEFYRLHCMTRSRHGLPPQPFSFFTNIYDRVVSKNNGFVVLASYDSKNIAGAVYFHFGTKALYKYGASDETYQSLRANNLVMWEAIKWYCQRGYTAFCFGRTDYDNEGLRQFKNGWGTEEKSIFYFRYDIKSEKFVSEDNGVKAHCTWLFKKLPNPVLKMIGHILYKHMG